MPCSQNSAAGSRAAPVTEENTKWAWAPQACLQGGGAGLGSQGQGGVGTVSGLVSEG